MIWLLNEKLQKYRIILSQHTSYLCEWLVHLNFVVFTAAIFLFFLARFLKRASLEQHSISFDGLAHLDWHFMEVGQHAYQTGWEWWMQAGSVQCDQKFLCKGNIPFSKAVPPNSDWFGLKYKYKVSSHMDNTRVLLHSRLTLGFNLNYLSFLL